MKSILYIFYFVKGCGSFELNVLFGLFLQSFFTDFITYFENFGFPDQAFFSISSKNTYLVESISKSLVAAFFFADFFWGAGSPIQENVILFLKISQVAWNGGSSWCFQGDFTIYEGSEKSYSMLISFKTCTAVPFDRSLVCKAIILIWKEMFRTLFASLSREMLVSIYKNILLHSVFLCGFLFSNIGSVQLEQWSVC